MPGRDGRAAGADRRDSESRARRARPRRTTSERQSSNCIESGARGVPGTRGNPCGGGLAEVASARGTNASPDAGRAAVSRAAVSGRSGAPEPYPAHRPRLRPGAGFCYLAKPSEGLGELDREMHDFIIVGGGSAGCTMAARMSELEDARVLLLESGPRDRNHNIHVPSRLLQDRRGARSPGDSTPPPLGQADGRRMIYPQARVLGGGRLDQRDGLRPPAMRPTTTHGSGQERCEGWSYAGVLPYFRRAEDNERYADAYHGSGRARSGCPTR